MAIYEYRCDEHGAFDVQLRMGTAPSLSSCPVCGDEAPRVPSLPLVRRLPRGARSALERSEASADSPAVVSALPANRKDPLRVTRDPRHRSLPRP